MLLGPINLLAYDNPHRVRIIHVRIREQIDIRTLLQSLVGQIPKNFALEAAKPLQPQVIYSNSRLSSISFFSLIMGTFGSLCVIKQATKGSCKELCLEENSSMRDVDVSP